jgi:hypothetical protein
MPQNASRPQLTMCIDVATRMPIGHHVSFGPPSIHTALLALQQALAWDDWGCPTEISIEADSHFLSTPMLQRLAELDNGGADEPDQES